MGPVGFGAYFARSVDRDSGLIAARACARSVLICAVTITAYCAMFSAHRWHKVFERRVFHTHQLMAT